jgi:uncharacterized protein involved in exopolysaccharide biosynthesis
VPRNTKVLEIEVTLPDPGKAHAVARFLADETIRSNRSATRASGEEVLAAVRRDTEESKKKYEKADRLLHQARSRPPGLAELEAELKSLGEQRVEIDRLRLSAELSVADQEDRRKEIVAAGPDRAWELSQLDSRLRSTRVRAARLKERAADLEAETERKQKLLADLRFEVEALASESKLLRDNMELEQRRLREVQNATDFRGERISLFDPGVVPERPSSPNMPLNLVIAAALALAGSFGYLTLAFALKPPALSAARPVRRMVVKS